MVDVYNTMVCSKHWDLHFPFNPIYLRQKQEQRDERVLVERQQRELEHQLLVARRKAIRQTRQKQLDMITAMKPGEEGPL